MQIEKNKSCFIDKYYDSECANEWMFLLAEKNELNFLFPFWRYLEYVHINNYSICENLAANAIFWKQILREIIVINLKDLLLDLVKRTLVWEFNVIKKKHPTITVHNFIIAVSENAQLNILLKKYPVLHDILENIICNHSQYLEDMFLRLKLDFIKIQQTFRLTDFKIKSFKLLGDNHCSGSRVALFVFQNMKQPNQIRKIIYKPRNVDLEKQFNLFLQFINKAFLNDDNPLQTLAVIGKNQYGWMEFAEHLTIDISDAPYYYYKLGILLGVCFSLNAQDLHFENIIASGSNPIIVDLECLFSPPITNQQLLNPYFPSVFETMLIPFDPKTDKRSYDLSGILNHAHQPALINHFEVRGNHVNDVYIERHIRMIQPVGNILIDRETGQPVAPSYYVENIIHGFNNYLNWLIDNKVVILDILKTFFIDLQSRILFRPTFVYSKILVESYHPKLLSSFEKYQAYLTQLMDRDNKLDEALFLYEIYDLFNADIPYFSTKTTSTKVYDSYNVSISWNLECTGFERVVNKINLINKTYVNNTAHEILQAFRNRYAE